MKKTIVGRCVEISEKNGWTKFSIDVGTQYPVGLSTKLPKLIEAARAFGDREGAWTFDETESDKINEHTNKPYINRYLDGVAEPGADDGGAAPAETRESAAPAQPATSSGHKALIGGDKDRAITRMNSITNAVNTLAGKHGDADDLAVGVRVLELAERYERWVYRDIEDLPF